MEQLWFSDATAIILAGGKSTRFGEEDKSMLVIRGLPMIQYIALQLKEMFPEVIIGSGEIEKYSFLGLKVVPDIRPGYGPLMGICSGLNESSNDMNFITACDIPEIDGLFISKLFEASPGADIVMPVRKDGRYEPLLALYHRSVEKKALEMLNEGKRKISDLTEKVNTVYVEFEAVEWYYNLNSMEDYLKYISETR